VQAVQQQIPPLRFGMTNKEDVRPDIKAKTYLRLRPRLLWDGPLALKQSKRIKDSGHQQNQKAKGSAHETEPFPHCF
jgi:hypothetical protein